ncbi:terminase small subunit [Apilactobacillus xinyiensis]|uniref:terminase small subunit n=1 Tax=Apilactobacillus xinyiensis TaxID=2841032 RepID=UPI003364FA05
MLVIVSNATQLRYEKFVDAYIKTHNGTKAAVLAGYSPKTARVQASQLLQRKDIQTSIQEHSEKIRDANIASETEVMQYYTRVMNNEEYDEVATAGGTFLTMPSLKDRNKAAEMLGKFHGSFTDKQEINANISQGVKIIDNIPPDKEDDNANA